MIWNPIRFTHIERRASAGGSFRRYLATGIFLMSAWLMPELRAQTEAKAAKNEMSMPAMADQTTISADTLIYRESQSVFMGIGNVVIVNGEIRITSDRLRATVDAESGEIAEIRLLDKVEIVHDDSRVLAGEAVYDPKQATVTFTKKPRVFHGPHDLSGAATISYDTEAGHFRTSNGRVRLQLKRDATGSSLVPGIMDEPAKETGGDVADPARKHTVIVSDSLFFDTEKRQVEFTGNVDVDDGEVRLGAESLEVYYDEQNRVTQINAKTNVVVRRNEQTARAHTANYMALAGVLEMSGDPETPDVRPSLSAPGMTWTSDRIIYRRDEGKLKAVGNPKIQLDKRQQ